MNLSNEIHVSTKVEGQVDKKKTKLWLSVKKITIWSTSYRRAFTNPVSDVYWVTKDAKDALSSY